MIAKQFRLPLGQSGAGKGQSPVRVFRDALFSLKVFAGNGALPRFGVIVSKKVDKRATRRNALRRLAMNVFREQIGKVKPMDYLLIYAPPAGAAEQKEIREKILKYVSPSA